ncbi:MAG TPA: helix-turn-helix domain-containing protein [Acidimicrobiales bacterium]|nr:helix-turn-helix domain-containing protein [Acidimicrobiales bacterium]
MAVDSAQREYLTPREAAEMLGVSPKTVVRWAAEGRIPSLVTLGGHRRFKRQEIEDLLEQMSEG